MRLKRLGIFARNNGSRGTNQKSLGVVIAACLASIAPKESQNKLAEKPPSEINGKNKTQNSKGKKMKRELLNVESATYKRRLIREINNLIRSGQSVYLIDYPMNKKVIAVGFGKHTQRIISHVEDGKFEIHSQSFMLGNGEHVVASRE